MKTLGRVKIRSLPTGVRGLDEILGGGLPEYSFNIIAGAPGCGKTTLAHQIMFASATPERPALFFTVLGEPALKMLRYQQQFSFFANGKLNDSVRYVNLSELALAGRLEEVLDAITKEVETVNPGVVVVDSFRAMTRGSSYSRSDMDLQGIIQRLAVFLTTWQATTFLIGEYSEEERRNNPVFTVADGLIWLTQPVERNSVVRKLQIIKMRGRASVPGLHTFRITDDGLEAFPRTFSRASSHSGARATRRLGFGNVELDAMLGGGIPEGDSLLVAGPSGAGKSLLGSNFIAEGLRLGESGVIAMFEERPEYYIARAQSLGMQFKEPQESGKLTILYLRPLDLSVDEAVHEIIEAVRKTGAKRLVIDSLAGLEMALAPGFRTDFRESLYRMMATLTRFDVTTLSTVEVQESFTAFPFSTYAISFLADDILRLRYVCIDGELRKVMVVVKMRGGEHSQDIREFQITKAGIQIGERLRGYSALISGIPEETPHS
jgi:circadian clock protein KaiC